ncbi:ribonuclease H [Buchnera aphidicola (Artemisaphis artemisicola)]|uniref:Ribonuclease H n=1 Tax=Buchnera aphidicola (Artemisaphis artemisicola) TaxID=1241836 RepID=A0A4D6XLY3_9GAMM|nr:ribonuclease H [Buchnera aphidicola (Artemisaphis artemisicola)]
MEKKKWKTTRKKSVKNIDLWLRINNALQKHLVNWFWVKSHIGHFENERCDIIAKNAAHNPSKKDIYYENSKL